MSYSNFIAALHHFWVSCPEPLLIGLKNRISAWLVVPLLIAHPNIQPSQKQCKYMDKPFHMHTCTLNICSNSSWFPGVIWKCIFFRLAETSIFFSPCSILHGCGYTSPQELFAAFCSTLPAKYSFLPLKSHFPLYLLRCSWGDSDNNYAGWFSVDVYYVNSFPMWHRLVSSFIFSFAVNGRPVHTFTNCQLTTWRVVDIWIHTILVETDYIDLFHFSCGADFCQESTGGKKTCW